MVWYVRHKGPSVAQFIFNWYRHWATLGVSDSEYRSGHLLHSKEGMTQGCTLFIITYGIGILPLVQELHDIHPCIAQPCYANDAWAGGNFVLIIAHVCDLQFRVEPQGYLLDPTNSILVIAPQNVARA